MRVRVHIEDVKRDHWTIMRDVWYITKLITRSKGKDFKNLFSWREQQLNHVIEKQPLLTSVHIFEQTGTESVRKDKSCRIIRELGSIKNSLVKYLNLQYCATKYMKLIFLIFSLTNLAWHPAGLMDGSKDGFYPMLICLWLKEDSKETVVWWYWLELSTKPLLNQWNSKTEQC